MVVTNRLCRVNQSVKCPVMGITNAGAGVARNRFCDCILAWHPVQRLGIPDQKSPALAVISEAIVARAPLPMKPARTGTVVTLRVRATFQFSGLKIREHSENEMDGC
ncbi:hypothetical protein BASA83_002755 [Batrachochytrium salamandrivorans]|nr:hypothetical protein BASA83_002755 [Batrachochytrium salamandrivorans]